MFHKLRAKTNRYDVIVIGGGAGGVGAALAARRKRVAIIDDSDLGGCYSKAVSVADSMRAAAANKSTSLIDAARTELLGKRIEQDAIGRLQAAHVKIINGQAHQVSDQSVIVNGIELIAKKIIDASGLRLKEPSFVIPPKAKVYSMLNILDLPSLPRRLAIIGSDQLGLDVAATLLSAKVQIALIIDSPIDALTKAKLRRMGATIFQNSTISTVERLQRADRINFIYGDKPTSVVVDAILLNLGWDQNSAS